MPTKSMEPVTSSEQARAANGQATLKPQDARYARVVSAGNHEEEANVELVRRMWDAFSDQGLVGILGFAAPDARWEPYTAGGRVFETTAEYRAYIQGMLGRDEIVEPMLSDVRARGDHVLVNGRMRIRGPSGLRDTNMYWVHRISDGEVVFTASFLTADEALTAAGLDPSA